MNFNVSIVTIALLISSGKSLNILSSSTSNNIVGDEPPPAPYESAKLARYITHVSDWASFATISTREPILGYPFNNILSLSDGPVDNSTGVPYLYVTDIDFTPEDTMNLNQVSLTMTLAQGDYCKKNNIDPESPLCARVMITGEFVKLTPGSEEESFAKLALFSRHPNFESWPADHGWYFAKIEIQHILLRAYFGGVFTIPVTDYFNTQI